MLLSQVSKINKLGQETLEQLLENNEGSPALLRFVVDRCYTGDRGISNGSFLALANVFSKHAYSCQLIPLLAGGCNNRIYMGESVVKNNM